MCVSEVDASRGDLEEGLAVTRDRVWNINDVEDLGTAEAGDLHGSHGVRLGASRSGELPGSIPSGRGLTRSAPVGSHVAELSPATGSGACLRRGYGSAVDVSG